jgi:hypothetical protein
MAICADSLGVTKSKLLDAQARLQLAKADLIAAKDQGDSLRRELLFILAQYNVEVKAVIVNSGCYPGAWGTYCFTSVKTIEKERHVICLRDNYGIRGDTLVLIVDESYTCGYRVK